MFMPQASAGLRRKTLMPSNAGLALFVCRCLFGLQSPARLVGVLKRRTGLVGVCLFVVGVAGLFFRGGVASEAVGGCECREVALGAGRLWNMACGENEVRGWALR